MEFFVQTAYSHRKLACTIYFVHFMSEKELSFFAYFLNRGALTVAVPQREAYATILCSENVYVCCAITVAESIHLTGLKGELDHPC